MSQASMRPRLIAAEYEDLLLIQVSRYFCFNEAAAYRRGIPVSMRWLKGRNTMLQ